MPCVHRESGRGRLHGSGRSRHFPPGRTSSRRWSLPPVTERTKRSVLDCDTDRIDRHVDEPEIESDDGGALPLAGPGLRSHRLEARLERIPCDGCAGDIRHASCPNEEVAVVRRREQRRRAACVHSAADCVDLSGRERRIRALGARGASEHLGGPDEVAIRDLELDPIDHSRVQGRGPRPPTRRRRPARAQRARPAARTPRLAAPCAREPARRRRRRTADRESRPARARTSRRRARSSPRRPSVR